MLSGADGAGIKALSLTHPIYMIRYRLVNCCGSQKMAMDAVHSKIGWHSLVGS
jgi:hypothetical protein